MTTSECFLPVSARPTAGFAAKKSQVSILRKSSSPFFPGRRVRKSRYAPRWFAAKKASIRISSPIYSKKVSYVSVLTAPFTIYVTCRLWTRTKTIYSEKFASPKHPQASLEELSPRLFSFNSPYGACKSCDGLGTILEFDPDLIVPDKSIPLDCGAVEAWRKGGKRMNIYYNRLIKRFCRNVGISKSIPFEQIPKEIKRVLLYGTTAADENTL